MTDVGFPIIRYLAQQSPDERGRMHGEQFRVAIQELVQIRSALMCEKNEKLTAEAIERLANEQWKITQDYDQDLAEELNGIRLGAGLSVEQLVILNNYTDFRDIQLDDQGCSMVFMATDDQTVAGQTWDMHGSAKNYVCCLDIEDESGLRQIVFSIVGCVGMMGFASTGLMIGVNNINTNGARAGVVWPAVVRRTLRNENLDGMVRELTTAPVTSGHNYMIADSNAGEMWEILPDLSEKVLDSKIEKTGRIFHTNHCLGVRAKERELVISQNSTTYIRFDLIAKKIGATETFADVYDLLNDHENYPKSICSNFQTNTQDPSITCGGAVGDLRTGQIKMWRGDAVHDENFVCHNFSLKSGN